MLKIKNFENVIGFDEFSLVKKPDSHSVCRFRAHIRYEDAEKFYNKFDSKISVSVDNEFIFFGYADEINMSLLTSDAYVDVTAISASGKIDLESGNRLFQNDKKKLKDIVGKAADGFSVEYRDGSDSISVENPVLQSDETGFEFSVRMAEYCGFHLYVDDLSENGGLIIGKTSGNADNELDLSAARLTRKIHLYEKSRNSRSQIHEFLEVTLSTPEPFLSVGNIVSVKGQGKYTVYEVRAEKIKERYDFIYTLCPEGENWSFKVPESHERIFIQAELEDNADPDNKGRVKVKLTDDIYDDADPDNTMWIDYRTPYSGKTGGIVFIPDKGDPVEVIFCRNTLTAGECVRKSALDDRFREVKNKYIADINNKSVSFTEEALKIAAYESTAVLTEDDIRINTAESTVFMDKDQISLNVTDNCSAVMKKDSITLSYDGSSEAVLNKNGITFKVKDTKILIKEKSIEINAGGTKIQLDSNTNLKSGKINIEGSSLSLKGSSNVKIEGSSISLK